MYLVRGNHENERVNTKYGFKQEFLQSYSVELYNQGVLPLYRELPLGYVLTTHISGLEQNVLFCHGGAPVVNTASTNDIKSLAHKYELWSVE